MVSLNATVFSITLNINDIFLSLPFSVFLQITPSSMLHSRCVLWWQRVLKDSELPVHPPVAADLCFVPMQDLDTKPEWVFLLLFQEQKGFPNFSAIYESLFPTPSLVTANLCLEGKESDSLESFLLVSQWQLIPTMH